LEAIATSREAEDVTWIFTDSQSSSVLGTASARQYQAAAVQCGSPFISVILHCELHENLRRAVRPDRGNGTNTKLTDVGILRSIREKEDIFHFADEYELELDVTHLAASETAGRIREHVDRIHQLGSMSKGSQGWRSRQEPHPADQRQPGCFGPPSLS
jgi:hypothetical protein